jgi:nitrite reductase/ring-hydroxylating ferredoxin subunit/uncharacterized membrane protein
VTIVRPILRHEVLERLERFDTLDRYAGPVQRTTRQLVPNGSALKDLLSGTWLGHPVHPVLTDVVIGAWTSAWFLDLIGGKRSRDAARSLIGVGIVAAVPTAAAGLSDWADLGTGPRRIGILHALGNTATILVYAMSWRARGKGHHLRGKALGMIGAATATASAYLGGQLSFGKGVGVDQNAFDQRPTAWTAVIEEEQLKEGRPVPVTVDGSRVLLYRTADGRIQGLADRCSHRGCSLSDGSVDEAAGTVTCPCHGSTFLLEDGTIVRGPATAPQPAFETRVRDGKVEVRAASR